MNKEQTCNGVCCTNVKISSVHQSLDELDFSRGIWSAALEGDVDKIKQFLSKPSADPDVLDSGGYTSLHYAARAGNVEICRILLNAGVNPNLATRAGHSTALHRAVLNDRAEIVELLLKYKADPSIRDGDGCTPLHKAAERGNYTICKLLHDLSPTLKFVVDKKGWKPVDLATREDVKNLLHV